MVVVDFLSPTNRTITQRQECLNSKRIRERTTMKRITLALCSLCVCSLASAEKPQCSEDNRPIEALPPGQNINENIRLMKRLKHIADTTVVPDVTTAVAMIMNVRPGGVWDFKDQSQYPLPGDGTSYDRAGNHHFGAIAAASGFTLVDALSGGGVVALGIELTGGISAGKGVPWIIPPYSDRPEDVRDITGGYKYTTEVYNPNEQEYENTPYSEREDHKFCNDSDSIETPESAPLSFLPSPSGDGASVQVRARYPGGSVSLYAFSNALAPAAVVIVGPTTGGTPVGGGNSGTTGSGSGTAGGGTATLVIDYEQD